MAARKPPKSKVPGPGPEDEPTEKEVLEFMRSMGLPDGIPVLCAVEDPAEDRRLAMMEARVRLPQLQTWMAFVSQHLNAVSASDHVRLMQEIDPDVSAALNLALADALRLIRQTAIAEAKLLGARIPDQELAHKDANHAKDAAERRADGAQLGDPRGDRQPGRVPRRRKTPRPE